MHPRTIHCFDSTKAAYDACQCCDEMIDGELLVIMNEDVVGVVDTWPYALTDDRGHLHPDPLNETSAEARIAAENLGLI